MSLRPYLLGAVALVLAGVVVWDYWPMGPDQAPSGAPVVAAPVVADTLNPVSQRPEADFAALFDHPLFAPSRAKPEVQPLPTEAAPVAQPAAPVPQPRGPAQPVLMGTVTSPWPGGVYLGDDQGGPVYFLRPGQEALGLHLEEARPDSALFMGPEGEVTLPLQKAAPFDPATALPGPGTTGTAAPDPNAQDLGAMAPGAVDPSLTDPTQPDTTLPDPGAADPAAPDSIAPDTQAPQAIAPGMPTAP